MPSPGVPSLQIWQWFLSHLYSFLSLYLYAVTLLAPSIASVTTIKCFGANDGHSGTSTTIAAIRVLEKAIRNYLNTGSMASNKVKVMYGKTMAGVLAMSQEWAICFMICQHLRIFASWNVSSVTTMYSMVRSFARDCCWDGTYTHGAYLFVIQFGFARAFNQPIGGWNVSSVTIMVAMVSMLLLLGWYLHSWCLSVCHSV
jgi:Mycoplasma protein of unknown function, DUF285